MGACTCNHKISDWLIGMNGSP
ncbi:DNA topoisomerase IA [Lactiplantibacillus plajomi]|uniref:Uncharacterized protein n=6 Tax=Lactobacillaceae TaxID=33958 RepID=U6FFD8_LACHE|nr:Protein of unknown function [Lactobacillus helveticus CIRM-BIA 104]